jgi:hypothetical protein
VRAEVNGNRRTSRQRSRITNGSALSPNGADGRVAPFKGRMNIARSLETCLTYPPYGAPVVEPWRDGAPRLVKVRFPGY